MARPARPSRASSSAAAWRPTSPNSIASGLRRRCLDYVTNTTCPNVHAADDRSVMETMEALPYQILSTRSFMGGVPYRIGPSQLGCRENAYGKSDRAQPRQWPGVPEPNRSAPARHLQRRLDARLCRQLRPRRRRGDRARRADGSLRPHPAADRLCPARLRRARRDGGISGLPRLCRPGAAVGQAAGRDRGFRTRRRRRARRARRRGDGVVGRQQDRARARTWCCRPRAAAGSRRSMPMPSSG